MGEDFINDRRDTREDIDNIGILKPMERFNGDDLKKNSDIINVEAEQNDDSYKEK